MTGILEVANVVLVIVAVVMVKRRVDDVCGMERAHLKAVFRCEIWKSEAHSLQSCLWIAVRILPASAERLQVTFVW